jgi:hypothetical protein
VGESPVVARLREAPEEATLRALRLGPVESFPSCHDIFEQDGEARAVFPVEDEARLAAMLFGCQAEAYVRAADGSRLLSYALPQRQERGTAINQRVARWDAQGKLLWADQLDRSGRAATFLASFRGASVADLPPYISCAATLWDTAVQALCVGREDGAVKWRGELPVWSGMAPLGLDKSLYIADHAGLRKLYPYTGEEQRFMKLADPGGGRLALYIQDGKDLYFMSNREAPWKIVAYDMSAGEERWSRLMSGQAQASWGMASAAHGRVLVLSEEHVVALDAATGQAVWRVHVGSDSPPVVWGDALVYVLARRPESSNLLWALDPKTGGARWVAPVPAGTLRLGWDGAQVLLGSVRSIQPVLGLEP